MEKALEFDPDNETVKNYINGINHNNGTGDIKVVKTPIKALKLPKIIAKDINDIRVSNPSEPIENYYYINGYYFKKGEKTTRSYFRKFKINDLQSVENIKTVQFDFNQEYEHPFVNKFSVTNLTTGKKSELNIDTVYITSVDDGMDADGDKYLNIPIPALEDNTEVEFIISIQSNTTTDTFNLETNYFTSSRPYQYMASFIEGDSDHITTNFNGNIQTSHSKELKVWRSHDIDKYKQESYKPDFHKIFPWVEMSSTKNNWKTIGNDYLEKIKDKLNTELSKGQLMSIMPDTEDPITITKELAQFVQSGITYQALEFGARAQIPNTTQETLANKYGDCKDHAVVLYDLLNKKGIKANLALVNTDKYINQELYTLDQFNHVILYLPNINGGIFIDTTDKYNAIDLSLPPQSTMGSMALILEKDKSKLVKIPVISADQNTIDIQREVSKTDNITTSTELVSTTGYIASEIRAYLQPIDKEHIKTEILKWINNFYPDLSLKEFNYYNLDKLEKPMIIEFIFEQNSDNSDFKVPAFIERVYMTYPTYEHRKYPFEFTEAFKIHSITQFKNEDFQLTKYQKTYHSIATNATLETTDHGQEFNATISAGEYPASDYKSFLETNKQTIYDIEKSIRPKN